jgi:hypothetical protein
MTPRASLCFPSLVVSCLALCTAAAACSSDANDRPAGVSSGGSEQAGGPHGGTSPSAGTAGRAGHSGADGGEGGVSSGGTGGDAGGIDVGTGQPPIAPSACSETAKWSGASSVDPVSSTATETLLSVTSDELDLAFLRETALYVAHRSQAGAAFSVGSAITIPSGWSVVQGAGLSPDGKRLLLVSDPDQRKLGELTRASRDGVFGSDVDESAFAAVNEDAVYTGKLYAYPVVSPGDDQLFFNSTFPMGVSTVVVSTRSGSEAWSAPVKLTSKLLDGESKTRRLPSGVSADARTLFYFNEETMLEEARFRDTPTIESPLYDMVSLGARRGAAPNAACNRLYSSSTGDVVVEKD